ncbi:MAG TPA: glycosyl hydrolase family 28-related protein [Patescibacteria group bacterium]|nr:glycosyl hydrolase family 28-related protein [Patescibacteria group bacterium]
MTRLPVVGSDDNTWGGLLNDFLTVEHNSDGTLKIRTDGTFYVKPGGGIPLTDLTAGVQTSLGKADSSVQTSLATGKGAMLAASGAGVFGALGVGSDGQMLTVDSTQALGVKWATASGSTDSNAVHKGDLLFNIVDYGATTGSTDNKTSIDNAITAAAVSGGVVFFPPGTWKTTGQHAIPLNVSVKGAGKGVTTISHRGVGTHCFFIGSNSGGPNPPNYMGRVGDFSLQGQSSGNGSGPWGQQIGIYILNCLFFNVQDVHCSVIYNSLLIDGGDEVALGAGTFAGNGYVSNFTSSNVYIGMHIYRWVTDTIYNFVYGYGNGPITVGSIGIWFDTKPSTSTLINASVEGFDTGIRISTSRQGLSFINPRLENCNTYVLWENNTWGHVILGGSDQPGIWATGTSAGSVTQIARDGFFPPIAVLPGASASYRHAIYRVDGGAGIADGIYVCTKDASNTYAWHEITTGNAGGGGSTNGIPAPTDQGLHGWTYDPTSMGSGGTALTSQRIQYSRVVVPSAGTITGVAIQVTGIPTGASNTFFGLYDNTGAQVAVTADVSASFGSTGTKQLAFTGTYSAAAGTYYIGFVQTGAPATSLSRAGLGSSTAYNLGTASAPFRFNTGATGQTALPGSVTLGSLSSSSDAYWLALY